MIKEAIYQLVNNNDLSYEMAEAVMDEIMSGEASQVLMSAYLAALRTKGETIEEITASAVGMRKHGVQLQHTQDVLEIVGTGGDEANSFNISTTAAFVIAAAGIPVAKHGNRSVSSRSGAADVLEALGASIMISQEDSTRILEECGFCFLFAQKYHSAMRFVGPVRKEIGIRTIFNLLGPLTNPAAACYEVMGVYEEGLVEPLAQVLMNLGVKRGIVVYGQDKLDEISISAPTTCCEIRDGELKSYVISPADFGFEMVGKEELTGGDAAENAAITKAILSGEKGAKRNTVVMNAAVAIYLLNDGVTLDEAARKAEALIDSGEALRVMETYVKLTQEAAEA